MASLGIMRIKINANNRQGLHPIKINVYTSMKCAESIGNIRGIFTNDIKLLNIYYSKMSECC